MLLTAVFLLSISALSFEILLVRIFSISQWNHLSFMVISITLFGFAAGGTFLNILGTRKKGWEKNLSSTGPIHIFVILFTLSTIISFVVLNRMPLDYFRLPLEPVQALYLLTAYLLLALPFFFAGLIVSLSYAFIPEKTGFVYFANMAGSACGAIIPVLLLPCFGEGRLIIFTALIPLIGVYIRRPDDPEDHGSIKSDFRLKRPALHLSSLAIVIIAGILITTKDNTIIRVKSSQYKGLSQTLQFPNTRIVETLRSIRGRFDRIQSPHIRFAPGLSLKFPGDLPNQMEIFKDGDTPFFLYRLESQNDVEFSKFTLPYSGYILVPHPRNILLIQNGGGSGILCAMASEAPKITIIEQQPQVAQLVRHHYNLPVLKENPRGFMARTARRYDIIHIENWGTSLPGSASLTQDYLFTIESLVQYFNHLTPNGILILSRKLLLPPSDSIRLWATAAESLRSFGIEHPEQHIAMLRNWNIFTLVVSPQTLNDTTPLKNFAHTMNFDVVYMPGTFQKMVNHYNVFETPYHFLEIQRLANAYRSGTERTYFEAYPLDVAPQTDNRPFPYRFLKWNRLKALYKMTGSRFYSLFMSGEIVVAVVFVEAVAISLLLLMLPLFTFQKGTHKVSFSHMLYFLSVGAGFIFIELFYIKEYILVFGDPVISLSIVLTGILISSGAGGYFSQRIDPQYLRHVLLALLLVLFFVFFGVRPAIHRIVDLPHFLGYVSSFLLLIPTGILMGLPFPLAMRHLLNFPTQRTFAWTANGCASVLASIASAQIALVLGISAIMIFAISAYFLALISTGKS